MKKQTSRIGTTITTLNDTFIYCREYPVRIGRKVEGCIGISTLIIA